MIPRWNVWNAALCSLLIVMVTAGATAAPDNGIPSPEPSVYLNMNEGGGRYAMDFSGNGNSGEIHNAARIRDGACGDALFFNGKDSYVAIPYRPNNHPEKEVTVDLWFAVDSFDRQVLLSTYNDGGYRIAFDDGNDLWWTVRTPRGDVSVPVQHESITLHRWHHLAGTYDGKTTRIYLDGVLRNVANASGKILYSCANDIMLGVDAGRENLPDPQCNGYFKGGIDEVRIYHRALTYGQVMDDRFSCTQEPKVPEFTYTNRTLPAECNGLFASLSLNDGEPVTRRIIVTDQDQAAALLVNVRPGSTLYVRINDAFDTFYADSWYLEIEENGRRLTRSIAFPRTLNTPADAVIPSGNATVRIRYFDGAYHFPSSAYVTYRSVPPPPPPAEPAPPVIINPIIVIYTASWATLIALILVFIWLHRRSKAKAG